MLPAPPSSAHFQLFQLTTAATSFRALAILSRHCVGYQCHACIDDSMYPLPSDKWCHERLGQIILSQRCGLLVSIPQALFYHIQVFAPTLPGYGRSEKPALAYSQHLWSSFLREFVVEVVRRPVVVVGNSIGGYISASLAAENPNLVKGGPLPSPKTKKLISRIIQ